MTPLRVAAVAVLVLVVGLAWAQTETTRPPDTPAPPPVSLSALVDQLEARFPKVEGDVVEVRGKTVTLSVGRRQGVRVGLPLSVVREGREIRHPRTNELLGRAEEPVGRATVTQVAEAFSMAAFEGGEVRVNDRVRSTTGKVRLSLVALRGTAKENLVEAVTHELYDGLSRSERFEVILGDQIAVWLAQQGIPPAEFLQGRGVAEVAARFKAENILAVGFSTVERKPFMDVRLFAAPVVEPQLSTAFFVPSSIKPRTPGQFSASDRSRPTPERKPRSLLQRLLTGDMDPGTYSSGETSIPLREVARFGFPVLALDMGVPADRVPRIVVSDGDRVYLYRIVNRALEAEWTYSGQHIGQVFSVYLVDLSGDGELAVVVNRYDVTLGLSSMILTGKNGKPSVLVDNIRTFLVALDEKGTGMKQTLWSQETSPTTLFASGKVERVAMKNGKLVHLERVVVPESFRATGVTMSNVMGKESRALVFVDEYNRLRLTVGGEEMWRSSSPVGDGGYLKLELPHRGADAGVSKFYGMEPTPLAVDLDGDGTEEIVVPQNQLPGMLGVVYRSPAGIRFQQVASGFEGMITGLGAIRGDEGEPPTLLACVVRFGGFLNVKVGGESQIIMTVQE